MDCLKIAAILFLAVVIRQVPTASAQEHDSLRVSWDGGTECTRADEVRAGALSMLEDPADVTPLDAHVRVESVENRFVVNVDITRDGSSGTRTLHVASCEQVVSAVALVLAYALDPRLAERDNESPVESHPTLRVETPSPSHETPSASIASSHSLRIGAGLSTGLSGLPSWGIGPHGHATLSINAFELAAALEYLTLASAYYENVPSQGAHFNSLYATLSFGYAVSVGLFQFVPNLGVAFGRIAGEGDGVSVTREGEHAYWAASLGGLVRLALSERLALELGARADVPLTHFTFELTGAGPLHAVNRVGANIFLSVSMRIL